GAENEISRFPIGDAADSISTPAPDGRSGGSDLQSTRHARCTTRQTAAARRARTAAKDRLLSGFRTRMSFTYYTVDTGSEASQIFWSFDTVADHVELCDHETTLPIFLQYLPRDEPILDAGCGLARWVIYLRARGYHVLGTDRAHGALVQAARSGA